MQIGDLRIDLSLSNYSHSEIKQHLHEMVNRVNTRGAVELAKLSSIVADLNINIGVLGEKANSILGPDPKLT